MKNLLVIALFIFGVSASAAPVIVNGSLNTSKDVSSGGWSGSSPDSWVKGGNTNDGRTDQSPDILDVDTVAGYPISANTYKYIVTASPSPDGGTWAGVANGLGLADFTEQISQSVSGFEIGKKYRISWYQANFGIAFQADDTSVADQDMGIAVSIDGEKIGQGTMRALQPGWELQSLDFTATAATHTVALGSVSTSDPVKLSYGSFDGVRIDEVLPPMVTPMVPTPVPSLSQWALALLSLAMAGFTAMGLRRSRMR